MKTLKVFTATWCNPCQQYKKYLNEFDDKQVNVVTVDVDAWKEQAIEVGVRSVPTTVLYENDVEIARKTGVMNLQQLDWFVNNQAGWTKS